MNLSEASKINKDLNDASFTMDTLMCKAQEASPALARNLSESRTKSIGMLLSELQKTCHAPYQRKDDLLEYMETYVSDLLDLSTAKKMVADLQKHPMVLTANHHGVDYFAQSLQGSLMFSLLKTSPDVGCTTVPVFACGNIPLNNLTYPRGIMIYKVDGDAIHKSPLLLPLFSDQRKRAIVSAVEPYDHEMLNRCFRRIRSREREKVLNPVIAGTVETTIREIYDDERLLSLDNYSDQSVVLNHRLWKRLFSFTKEVPSMVYLELERIVAHLLTLDLREPDSLAAILIFDDSCREKLLDTLDGTPGCWDQQLLALRHGTPVKNMSAHRSYQGCGTHFFWGIDDSGRRFPLRLEKPDQGKDVLCGIDDRGKNWSFDFSVDAILELLERKKLVPSLFTSYMAVSFSRGLTCIGGYYQSNYLPKMQNGVVRVLEHFGSNDIARKIASVPTNGYLSGMQTITTTIDNQYLIPAGPLEIIANGGLSKKEMETIPTINVYDAHLASLCDTVVDIIPQVVRKQDWKKPLFSRMFQSLLQRTICKRYAAIQK